MFNSIIFYQILGIPLIIIGGIITFLFFLATALVGYFGVKGRIKNHYKIHTTLAVISIILGFIHGILGIISLF